MDDINKLPVSSLSGLPFPPDVAKAQLEAVERGLAKERNDGEQLAQRIYEICATEISEFIDEYHVDVRKPLSWEELTQAKKDYWQKYAKQILFLMPSEEAIRKEGRREVVEFIDTQRFYSCPLTMPYVYDYRIDMGKWRVKLEEWGLKKGG
jgi:hypothetical protein